MWRFIPVIFLVLIMCSHAITDHTGYSKITGIAHESKAGIEVDGVMLINIAEDKYPDYIGKKLRVTGRIEKKHPWKIKPYKKGEPVSQGFDMPIMRDIKSIEIIE